MTDAAVSPPRDPEARRTLRLWAEFTLLFLGVPLAMATVLPPRYAFTTLAVMTLVGLALLAATRDFSWRSLLPRRFGGHWRLTLAFVVAATATLLAVALWLAPHRLFGLAQARPELWVMILLLYPFLSVLPQELLYRGLFFERYGALFGGKWSRILVNAGCFGLAHLFYANPVAIGLSTLGGIAFAYAYVERRSFGLAVLWHTLAGQLLFTIGLGLFFYHGAIPS